MIGRIGLLLAALVLTLGAAPAPAAPSRGEIDALARDLDRAESVRAVKTLQRSYAQYAQFGQWRAVGALFAADGKFVFDGLVEPGETAAGPQAIAGFLRARYGGGHDGLGQGDVSTLLIDAPMVSLAPDGESAKGRWSAFFLLAHDGVARIEGGIFENDYARSGGKWRIATVHYYPLYEGPYQTGWTNRGGGDLPLVPYHFTPENAGIPIPPPTGPAPRTRATLAELEQRIGALNDEDTVRNLQAALGYYIDRKMWDDVTDLLAADGSVSVGSAEPKRGKAGVREWLEATMGPAGLEHGELNDRPQFDVTVDLAPDRRTAIARGIELGMLGEADQERASWEVTRFENEYVKQGGVWKLAAMHRLPQFSADYDVGWGAGSNPRFATATAPMIPTTTTDVYGESPEAPPLPELRRRLARSTAYDGVENVSAAYSAYLDDLQSDKFGALIAEHGFKMSAFAGYYVGRARVTEAGVRVWGKPPVTRPGVVFHWRIQPVIMISDDGRSANLHIRLWQPRTGKEVGGPGGWYGAYFYNGMYHDQFVLEDGAWKMFNLSLDEPYMSNVAWKVGWARAKDPAKAPQGAASLLTRDDSTFKPDVPIALLGAREEHFRGGTGETWQWPTILPMWFEYRNPVSGRAPEHFQADCPPCAADPNLRLDHNGYQQPPMGPEPPAG